MAQRRRGSTATPPQTTLSDLIDKLPEPSKAFEPETRTYKTVRAEQEAWVKETGRWGR